MTRALRVGKGAHSLGGFIIISHQEVIQAFMPELFEEPLAAVDSSLVTRQPQSHILHGARHTCKGPEAPRAR